MLSPPARSRRDGGYVTVVVLTFAGLMAALVAATLNVARPSVGQAVLNLDDMRADGFLEAGVAAAGYALFAATRRAGGLEGLDIPMERGQVRVSARPEAGRIDLNSAHPRLLDGLYQRVGSGAFKPGEFAARVADWRDRNDRARPGGAESEEYAAAGLAYGPRNAPFLSIEELLLLPGMTEEDHARLAPYLTVFSPDGLLDPAGADVAALMAVPNMTEAEATGLMLSARDPNLSVRELRRLVRPFRNYLAAGRARVYRVRAEARLDTGYVKSVEAVVMAGGRRAPYRVLYWRVLDPAEAAT